MIDFSKKISLGKMEKKTEPLELYNTLDRKSAAGPLRSVQTEILDEWYKNRRMERDIIIKLNTGDGKTLIGLLILQSKINSKEGPCLYVCPNIQLVSQVCTEADKFGIPYCTVDSNELPNEFMSGEKILITHAQKVFNGKTIFKLSNSSVRVDTIILDDAHACIDTIKDSFSIVINRSNNKNLYEKFLVLFEEDLKFQREGSYLDIKNNSDDSVLAVPYWSWLNKKDSVLEILSENKDIDNIKFAWPLVKDNLIDYRCIFSGTKIEISPYNANIKAFGTFSRAKHRILMSATTQNDVFFIKGLDFSENSVIKPLIPRDNRWSGEKMIIFPSLVDNNCGRNTFLTELFRLNPFKCGIVALVNSKKTALSYENLSTQFQNMGAIILDKSNINIELKKLKDGSFDDLRVIVNRYDGIDLPDDSCRLLIVDSMPYAESLSDRYECLCRPHSEILNKKLAQKIEQGIGRGVRGEKDYCAIVILGSDLEKFMRGINRSYFSQQTQKQVEIGSSIAKMLIEDGELSAGSIKKIFDLIKQMLDRDDGWKAFYKNEMDELNAEVFQDDVYEKLAKEKAIQDCYLNGEIDRACNLLQELINVTADDLEKGWYLQELARMQYMLNLREKSIVTQKSAFKQNNELLRPKDCSTYQKLSYLNDNRIQRIRNYVKKFSSVELLNLHIRDVIDNLSFGVDSNKFESALQELGEMLGFISQRPDKELGKGPDNLWCGKNDTYFMFECKTSVNTDRKAINKEEAGQMNSHCGWFESMYGGDKNVFRFIIIPTRTLTYEADFTHRIRIIRPNKLSELKKNVKAFYDELTRCGHAYESNDDIDHLLDSYSLNMAKFEENYSEEVYHNTKKN